MSLKDLEKTITGADTIPKLTFKQVEVGMRFTVISHDRGVRLAGVNFFEPGYDPFIGAVLEIVQILDRNKVMWRELGDNPDKHWSSYWSVFEHNTERLLPVSTHTYCASCGGIDLHAIEFRTDNSNAGSIVAINDNDELTNDDLPYRLDGTYCHTCQCFVGTTNEPRRNT